MAEFPEFMNAKLVAEYLDLNEKKVYALANDGLLPATKVTGKWLFPKAMLDKWLLESCHNGVLTDRLLIAGSDDPLLQMVVGKMANQLGSTALVGYTSTGTRQGLAMLSKGHVDMCAIHWGNAEEASLRHPALLQQYQGHKNWVLVHAFEREQGLVVSKELAEAVNSKSIQLPELLSSRWRWALRQEGAGSMRALEEWLHGHAYNLSMLNQSDVFNSERELASSIARGQADVGCASQSTAGEFGLGFIPLCTEAFELVIPKNIYFRTLQQQLLQAISEEDVQAHGKELGGYNFARTGKQVWSAN
ncbi:DNA-binding protein [Photobacterium angustum]|uniref:helix-turn-helix transcriptional regulator n=1 Tax=Photobacterium angustum TaxID=661 RepID=UPI0005E01CA0|nr:helix-turn-helix transcriptional regulator [Photobacterium angustum]KJF95091.1 DNA-binding protein [Photobacterium angustum]KJG07706.1 DNA-binding protein [Photobacterium angustum]PSV89510.1 helix-turn-helix domain-containing protein [Photobacterium angustum]PSW81231.1 helix-turn-helix domain-containing protein [Photobacterium angustum]